MTTASEIIKAAIPDATPELCEHVLWARTPFPCGAVSPRNLYRAAARLRRAMDKNIKLCDHCDNIAVTGCWMCAACDAALHPKPATDVSNDGQSARE